MFLRSARHMAIPGISTNDREHFVVSRMRSWRRFSKLKESPANHRASKMPNNSAQLAMGTGRPAQGALIHISITVPLFSELRRVGSVERGEKCTTKGRKIR